MINIFVFQGQILTLDLNLTLHMKFISDVKIKTTMPPLLFRQW